MGRTTEGVRKKGEEGQGDEEKRIFPFFGFPPLLIFSHLLDFRFFVFFCILGDQGTVSRGGRK